jgi:hypothetical protein
VLAQVGQHDELLHPHSQKILRSSAVDDSGELGQQHRHPGCRLGGHGPIIADRTIIPLT